MGSEAESEPTYVDYGSDLEDGFDNSGNNNHDYDDFREKFEEFLKGYDNPNLEGGGDSDEVIATEIEEELDYVKMSCALADFCERLLFPIDNRPIKVEDEPTYVDFDEDDDDDFQLKFQYKGGEIEQEKAWTSFEGSDVETNTSSYEYDDSGYVVGRKLKRVGEEKDVQSDGDSSCSAIEFNGFNYQGDAESSADEIRELSDDDNANNVAVTGEQSEEFPDSYASGRVVVAAADCGGSDSGDSEGGKGNSLSESQQQETMSKLKRNASAIRDFPCLKRRNVSPERDFPCIKRRKVSAERDLPPGCVKDVEEKCAEGVEDEGEQIVLALMAPRFFPWRDSNGQLKKRACPV